MKSAVEAEFGSWTADGHSVVIEYSQAVVGELRAAAVDGLHRLSRGGVEAGGVLFGERRKDGVRILQWRPIFCSYARGPSFLLSEEDEDGLRELLASARTDHELKGLVAVGWFHSHTRSDILLRDSDLDLFARFFPEPWQVALVLRPSPLQSARAGFFFREADGKIRAGSSYREFVIGTPGRVRGARERPPAVAGGRTDTAPVQREAVVREAAQRPRQLELIEPPRFLAEPPRRRRWPGWRLLLIAAGLSALAIGAAALRPYLPLLGPADPRTVSLRVVDVSGQLLIDWDHNSKLVREADRASLEFFDGAAEREVALDNSVLRRGSSTYARLTEEVKLRIKLYRPGQPVFEEWAHFVGGPAPTKTSPELLQARERQAELEADLKATREELRRESLRARRFEHAVKALQDRLAVREQAGQDPAPATR